MSGRDVASMALESGRKEVGRMDRSRSEGREGRHP